ncbi:hypothetical protein [Streptomyces sp. NPDC052107]|uniref:hypothetical protein n=1 Tax=Streptomyces sp. NPDC052107 TaxID=3155632 RepID=UPI00343110CE
MSITAHLRDSVRLPGGHALVNGFAFESRGTDSRRALLQNGHELEVYDLGEVFAGERAPRAVFPVPWPGWDRGVHSVSPDGTFAVFSGQRAVRAVGTGGELDLYPRCCFRRTCSVRVSIRFTVFPGS